MTAASDPGFIASLTTVHLLLLLALAVAVIFVMTLAARRRRRGQRDLDRVEERREQAGQSHPDVGDQPLPETELPRDTELPAGPPPRQPRVDAPTAPPPPPLAETPVIGTAATLDTGAPATATATTTTADMPVADAGERPADAAFADELTRMKGVGPKLAARLNELGITRFAQVAALSPDDAAALDAQLGSFQGRMARDRWVEQAGFLARGDVSGYEAVFGKLSAGR